MAAYGLACAASAQSAMNAEFQTMASRLAGIKKHSRQALTVITDKPTEVSGSLANATPSPSSSTASATGATSTPIGRMTLDQIDAALDDCDKTIKARSDSVKTSLVGNSRIPTAVLRELSAANNQRSN